MMESPFEIKGEVICQLFKNSELLIIISRAFFFIIYLKLKSEFKNLAIPFNYSDPFTSVGRKTDLIFLQNIYRLSYQLF
jgi:hypothetical protein